MFLKFEICCAAGPRLQVIETSTTDRGSCPVVSARTGGYFMITYTVTVISSTGTVNFVLSFTA